MAAANDGGGGGGGGGGTPAAPQPPPPHEQQQQPEQPEQQETRERPNPYLQERSGSGLQGTGRRARLDVDAPPEKRPATLGHRPRWANEPAEDFNDRPRAGGPPTRGRGRGRGRGGARAIPRSKDGEEEAYDGPGRFIYGNYDRYYGYRTLGAEDDARLRLLDPAWFRGKDVLDIGCNTGMPTIAIAVRFEPRAIVGVDIDASLVARAERNRDVQASLMEPLDVWLARPEPRPPRDPAYFPASCPLSQGLLPTLPREAMDLAAVSTGVFPYNVEFIAGDVVNTATAADARQYDTILCWSVTKWVHLNWGDDGIRKLFAKVFALLKPGGRFILEPQAYSSYYRRSRLTPAIQANYRAIQLRPEAFSTYLLETVGFKAVQDLGTPDHASKGFQRPILVFTK